MMKRECLTTAWFVRHVRLWFDVMNGRNQSNTITNENKHHKLSIIDNFLFLIEKMDLGGTWKPVQTGLKISCLNSTILINRNLEQGYKYFHTSRLNQDAIENLFSTIRRHGNTNPTALQVKTCLRLITISQFTNPKDLKNNYNLDDDEIYNDFFKKPLRSSSSRPAIMTPAGMCLDPSLGSDEDVYDPIDHPMQCNIINNVIGGSISYVLRKTSICEPCVKILTGAGKQQNGIFTQVISYGYLENPSLELFKYFCEVEAHLQEHLVRCQWHP